MDTASRLRTRFAGVLLIIGQQQSSISAKPRPSTAWKLAKLGKKLCDYFFQRPWISVGLQIELTPTSASFASIDY